MVFSMRVQCENCPIHYNMKPSQVSKHGMFKLCYYCRQNPPSKYRCLAKTQKGEQCKNTRAFGSQFCFTHRGGARTSSILEAESKDFTLEEIKINLGINNELLDELNEKYQRIEDQDEKEEISSWVVHYVQENCHLIELMEYKLKRE